MVSTSSSPYQPAASLVNELLQRHISLKSLVYDKNGNFLCSKATYAQVCHTMDHLTSLQALLQQPELLDLSQSVKNQGLLLVLLYELLLGPNKSIKGGGAVKRKLLKLEEALRKTLARIQIDQPSVEGGSSDCPILPRYVRVNTIRTTTKNVVKILREIFAEQDDEHKLFRDAHVPDLLVLPPSSTALLQTEARLSQSIILQDKSSCFTALCLVHGFNNHETDCPNHDYLDACAAPGNKTSHLAALVAAQEKRSSSDPADFPRTIYALDRSKQRLESLQHRLTQLGISVVDHRHHDDKSDPSKTRHKHSDSPIRVVTQCQDFLATKPSDYTNVGSILLDPTCSGSGQLNYLNQQRQEPEHEASSEQQQLQSLSNFQVAALKHAMSFPSVHRIAYSTCSIHPEENEEVIARVLCRVQNEPDRISTDKYDSSEWKVVAPTNLKDWPRRGQIVNGLTADEAAACIRVDARHDHTHGFFVCCLQRMSKASSSSKEKSTKSGIKSLFCEALASLPIYQGEFSTKTELPTAAEAKDIKEKMAAPSKRKTLPIPEELQTKSSSKKRKSDPPLKNDKTPKASDSAEPKLCASVESRTKSTVKKRGESNSMNNSKQMIEPESDAKLSKKQLKKRAWKKRQHELKVKRLKNSGQEASASST